MLLLFCCCFVVVLAIALLSLQCHSLKVRPPQKAVQVPDSNYMAFKYVLKDRRFLASDWLNMVIFYMLTYRISSHPPLVRTKLEARFLKNATSTVEMP